MDAFCRVVESGSLGKAGLRMALAKSMVATRVQHLETHLGVPLFHRSTRTMKLSEAGRRYYVECMDILARVRRLSADRDDAALNGRLAIQVLPGFALGRFSAVLVEFCAQHPAVTLDVTVSDKLIDPVNEGIDIVFQIYAPVSDLLIERRLFQNRGVFCASHDYLTGAPPLNEPQDLLRHRFARYANYPWDDHWPFHRDGEQIEVRIAPVLKTNSVPLLLEYVLQGAGVAYLPTMLAADDIGRGRLVHVLPDYEPPPLWMSAVYPASHRATPKVRAFLDLVAKRFPAGSTLNCAAPSRASETRLQTLADPR